MLIAGDIGGTKTDLAIFTCEAGPHSPLVKEEVHSAYCPSLQALVTEFVGRVTIPVERASFDVAGPVIDGRVKITNLAWIMDEVLLARDLNLKSVRLMNDLEAVAKAIPCLGPSDVHTLNDGQPVAHGAIGVVAPGTGLGESFLTWEASNYVSHSSEARHANFAPTDERQIGLLQYLLERHDHVGVEHVCSGIGIPDLYEYLRDVEQLPESSGISRVIAAASDRTAAIVNFGGFGVSGGSGGNPSPLCAATVDLFVSILAGEAGNVALKVLGFPSRDERARKAAVSAVLPAQRALHRTDETESAPHHPHSRCIARRRSVRVGKF